MVHAVDMTVIAGNGGCFPMHFDTYEGQDTRTVTAITYLNPDYDPSHGGQLRLYPFPSPPVDIEPRMDRTVRSSDDAVDVSDCINIFKTTV